jgi:hypothetical protein
MIDTNKKYVPPEKYRPKPRDPNKKPEKVKGFTVASFIALHIIFILKYLLDFVLLPHLFPDLYPLSVAAIIIWTIETIVVCTLCIKFVTGFGYFYIPAILVYSILIAIWPNNLYHFGVEIPAIVGGLIAYVASRLIERALMWFFIAISFITM